MMVCGHSESQITLPVIALLQKFSDNQVCDETRVPCAKFLIGQLSETSKMRAGHREYQLGIDDQF